MEVGWYHRKAVPAQCSALAQNQRIRRVVLTTAHDSASDGGLLSLVAKFLLTNSNVADVAMRSEVTSLRSIKSGAFLLSKNTRITKPSLTSACLFYTMNHHQLAQLSILLNEACSENQPRVSHQTLGPVPTSPGQELDLGIAAASTI